MLKLTPLEETTAGKELIQIGVKRGLERGIEQGELRVLVRQLAHKFDLSPDLVSAALRRLTLADFEALSEFVLDANSFADIDAWVTARASTPNGN